MSVSDLTSWSLIRRAAGGSCLEQDAFVRRYTPVVRSYFCARWKLPFDHGQIDDATQEVFVDCFKPGGVLERVDPAGPADFRGFLYGVTKRTAETMERKRFRSKESTQAVRLDGVQNSEATLSQEFDRAWVQLVIREAGALMKSRCGESGLKSLRYRLLRLRFEDGAPPREIARQLQLGVSQVYEQLREAKQDFRAALLEVLAAYHPSASEHELKQRWLELLELL